MPNSKGTETSHITTACVYCPLILSRKAAVETLKSEPKQSSLNVSFCFQGGPLESVFPTTDGGS